MMEQVERFMQTMAQMPANVSSSSFGNETSLVPSTAPSVSPTIDDSENPNEVPLARFVIYLLLTFFVLTFVLLLSRKMPPPTPNATTPTTTTTNTVGTTSNQQQRHINLVKGMSTEERKEYVTNFLKTQKFVDENNNTSSIGSNSFRVTRSSSFQINNDIQDDDIEEGGGNGKQYPSCAICLDRFHSGEDICCAQNKLCRHEFHLECIFPWLLKSQDCPCCRRDYLSIIETDRVDDPNPITTASSSNDGDTTTNVPEGSSP